MPSTTRTNQHPAGPFSRTDAWLLIALVTVAAAITMRGISTGGFRYDDEAVHAMDGVLIHDWLAAGPPAWRDPINFAIQQYAHHPALGMVGVYPPGFAVVEAGFFAVFGVSIFAARLAVACCAVAAVIGLYLWTRRLVDTRTALLAAACLLAMPITVTWSRRVMLEIPTAALLIWAAYALDVYTARRTWRWLLLTVACLVAAPLVKQTALVLVPVFAAYVVYLAARGRIAWRAVALAAVLLIVPLGTYYCWSLALHGGSAHMTREVTLNQGLAALVSGDALAWYARTLPDQAGMVVLVAAAVGLLVTLRRWDACWSFVLMWAVVYYMVATAVQHRVPRFLFPVYVPLAIWAGVGLAALVRRLPPPRLRMAAAGAGAAALGITGFCTPIAYAPSYAALAQRYASELPGRFALFEGRRDGNFIFAVRCATGPRRSVVVRASKTLYSCASHIDWEYTAHVQSPGDVRALLDQYGFDYIFVERRATHLPPVRLLRAELTDPDQFCHVGSHTLHAPAERTSAADLVVDVYRPRWPMERSVAAVEIPVPIIGRTITLDYDQLGAR